MAGQITVISRWESRQMPAQIEWQLWRQLRGAFEIKQFNMVPVIEDFDVGNQVRQYETMEEAIWNNEGAGQLVFLEPTGQNSVADIPQDDIVVITGCTILDNKAHAKPEETYRVHTPTKTVLYASNAVAIALAIRYGQ